MRMLLMIKLFGNLLSPFSEKGSTHNKIIGRARPNFRQK